MRRVQLQGGARGPHARRTLCTLSVRPRAPTKQMGPYHRSSLSSFAQAEAYGILEPAGEWAVAWAPVAAGVEQHGVEPGGARAHHVDRVEVADVEGRLGLHPRLRQAEPEDARVGLLDADDGGIDDEVEIAGEARLLENGAYRAIGVRDHARDQPRGLDAPEGGRRLRVRPVPEPHRQV